MPSFFWGHRSHTSHCRTASITFGPITTQRVRRPPLSLSVKREEDERIKTGFCVLFFPLGTQCTWSVPEKVAVKRAISAAPCASMRIASRGFARSPVSTPAGPSTPSCTRPRRPRTCTRRVPRPPARNRAPGAAPSASKRRSPTFTPAPRSEVFGFSVFFCWALVCLFFFPPHLNRALSAEVL